MRKGRGSNYYGESHASHKGGGSIKRGIVRLLFALVSIVAALALALTLLAPIVGAMWWVFPILGVAAPIIYLANFIIAMVWILRWRWKFALPIIVLLLLGSGKVTRFMKLDMDNNYGETSRKGQVKIMTYNVHMFLNDKGERSTKEMSKYLDSIAPDIVCFQEFNQEEFDKCKPKKFAKYYSSTHFSMGIYSKYPIVKKSEDLTMENPGEGLSRVMWVDVKISNDTVRVFSNHLVSTMIKSADDEYLTSREFMHDSMREYKFADIVSRFNDSSTLRAQHADSLAVLYASSPYRYLVCGDFNDTPMSYTYRVITEGLQDSFVECGVGYPHTFRGFKNLLRIDYILASEGINFTSYNIDTNTTLSDHLPVTAHFILTK